MVMVREKPLIRNRTLFLIKVYSLEPADQILFSLKTKRFAYVVSVVINPTPPDSSLTEQPKAGLPVIISQLSIGRELQGRSCLKTRTRLASGSLSLVLSCLASDVHLLSSLPFCVQLVFSYDRLIFATSFYKLNEQPESFLFLQPSFCKQKYDA